MIVICLFVLDGPTTAGTGVAKCVMRYDGTDPQCGLQCNNPYVFFFPSHSSDFCCVMIGYINNNFFFIGFNISLVPNAAKNNCV